MNKVQKINGVETNNVELKTILETSKFIILYAVETNIITRESRFRFNVHDKIRDELSAGIYIRASEVGNKITELKNYGVRITPLELAMVIKNIRDEEEESIPRQYLADGYIGWHSDLLGRKFFIGSTIIGKENIPLAYNGNNLVQAGSLKSWINCCKTIMNEKMAAQVIIATGFAAILIGLLGEKSMFLNISGIGGSGKTSICDLVTTINSKKEDANIYGTFDSTDISLGSIGSRNKGVALVIDDSSNSKDNNFKRLVYKLSGGIGRGRSACNGEKKLNDIWSTAFITSSESSFYHIDDKITPGMVRRLIEVRVSQGDITTDAQQAEHIKEVIESNYGLAGNEFAKYILKLGQDKVKEFLDDERIEIQGKASKDTVLQAKSKLLSFITGSAKLLNEALEMEFDIEEMERYLLTLSEEDALHVKSERVIQKEDSKEAYRKLCKHAHDSQNCVTKDGYYHIPMIEFNKKATEFKWISLSLRQELQKRGLTKVKPKKQYNEILAMKGQVVSIVIDEEEI